MIGTGASARHKKPKRLLPQPTPRASYIACPARGRKAAKRYRRMLFAARTEAALCGPCEYTRYAVVGMMMAKEPKPTKKVPSMGTIQWARCSALQPYQKKPIGNSGENHVIRCR